MTRHVIGSINVLLRKDLGYGAVTDWNFSLEERYVELQSEAAEWKSLYAHATNDSKECFCNFQFNVKACSIQGIFKTADVVKNDPSSLSRPPETVDVMSKYPPADNAYLGTLLLALN